MESEKYYIGSDLKFDIAISSPGFSQEDDNYEIEFWCGDDCLTFEKKDVIQCGDKFYLPVPTSTLHPGKMKMVIRAYVPDTDFEDGYRTEIAVRNLGILKEIQ